MTAPPPPPPGYTAIVPQGFNAHIGPVLLKDGAAPDAPDRFQIQLRPHMLNGADMAHGGFLMSVADIIMGYSVHEATGGQPASTVTLNCDFVSAAKGDALLLGRTHITRRTRSLVFVSAELAADGKPVLAVSGIWKVLGAA